MASTLYTIGHSNHPVERFIALLEQHDIEVLADVRSTPFSRFNPQFNRERLKQTLAARNIQYLFLGDTLGARSADPAHYENNRVSYRKLAASEPFQRGLQQLLSEAHQYRTVIMCAEKEPLDCHRTILLARAVERADVPIRHILSDGSIEEHRDVMQRLIAKLKLPQGDMFDDGQSTYDTAYDLRGASIAYSKPS